MVVITEAIDTKTRTVELIKKELFTIAAQTEEPRQGKIKLSLDLTRPEYIMAAYKDEEYKLNYFMVLPGNNRECSVYTQLVREDSMDSDIAKMLDKVSRGADEADFQKRCYEAYQLDWMMSHGFGLSDIRKAMDNMAYESYDRDCYVNDEGCFDLQAADMEATVDAVFHDTIDAGFGGGSCFVCRDEFLDAEYMDPDYMRHLLENMPEPENQKKKYEKYTGILLSKADISVPTSAGVLNAYKSCDPDRPGICIMLQPKDYDCEIDVCLAEVCQAKEEDKSTFDQGPEDVRIICWGDATTEDYTSEEVVKRADVLVGLSEETPESQLM